ncbi:hypothetical protein HMPREF1531_00788 [Propionibacterium sp. oral taxon 192 str. F0372]|nr:hypothetical protein HMPREF1531_00788 [Propionibacterium sp. oral taxon 192 str. F0372]
MIVPTAFWEYQETGSAEALAALHQQIKADPYFTERAPCTLGLPTCFATNAMMR